MQPPDHLQKYLRCAGLPGVGCSNLHCKQASRRFHSNLNLRSACASDPRQRITAQAEPGSFSFTWQHALSSVLSACLGLFLPSVPSLPDPAVLWPSPHRCSGHAKVFVQWFWKNTYKDSLTPKINKRGLPRAHVECLTQVVHATAQLHHSCWYPYDLCTVICMCKNIICTLT